MEFAIADVHALVRRERREEAQRLLERVSAQVLPILTKRRFRVRKLHEFFPKNPNLLGMNVNRGVVIYIRLRPQHRPSTFLPYEALLETMLHELTHMIHGPHNQAFYTYLDGLKDEMESLMLRGLLGREGALFQDAGVGNSIETETSVIAVRHANDNRAAVLAAARRAKYQRLLGGVTTQRLGSTNSASDANGLTAAQLRARALDAAERRRRDNDECALSAGLSEAIEILGIDDSSDEEQVNLSTRPAPRSLAVTDGTRIQGIQDAIAIDEDATPEPVVVVLVDDDSDGGDRHVRQPRPPEIVDLTAD